ncbi:MAG: DEAD/DEAH box helicase, partial [Spirochaetales bacterium]
MPSHFPESFHPLLRDWFIERYGHPTPVQAAAWPRIAAGEHVLASAPTGTGKTLTAFLDALSRFANGSLDPDRLSVLYVSPLKALNEDVRLNLIEPAKELSAYFAARGERFPRIRVATRSGDTTQAERRRALSDPPSILCTTPESLSILLASKGGLGLLSGIRLVVLDEIHALMGTRRGALLACSVGRLALMCGEFQRVALSATVNPFEAAARFVGARRLVRKADGVASWEERPVAIVAPPTDKRYELSVLWPAVPLVAPSPFDDGGVRDGVASRYAAIVGDLAARLAEERGVIAFTDSRRRAERLAAMLNEAVGEGTAWAHHGSLSRDVRRAVERRLKEGSLPCVVATSSLELGIDVGSVGLVALAGTPSRADQALQRLGRSGHRVGQTSRGLVYPFHGLDLLQAAAIAEAVAAADVDPVKAASAPLDVLAQVLLSMALFEPRKLDELFDELRSFAPYVDLDRDEYDAVVGMLSGRYAGTRVKELAARVYLDTENGIIRAREGAAMLLYSSGGAIPDRGYYSMRLAGGGARIGELDEEFVFERRVGNSFNFGAQAWRIVAIGDESVEVVPLDRDADFMPFWKAEKASRGISVADRMLGLCESFFREPAGFGVRLRDELGFSDEAADTLVSFLARQVRSQGGALLPTAHSVSIEMHRDPDRRPDSTAVFIHTLRGLSVNEPFGLALAACMGERLGATVDRLSNDDSIFLLMPLSDREEVRAVVRDAIDEIGDSSRLASLLRAGLEDSGAFGAAFRENAGRALLLPKAGFSRRTPLWITRLRAKRLFERVRGYPDFPVVKESWRSVLQERYDMPRLSNLCAGLADGHVAAAFFSSIVPSPFGDSSGWAETNRYLYEGDQMHAAPSAYAVGKQSDSGAQSVGDRAIENALQDSLLRPTIPASVMATYGRRARREEPGWNPETPDALADWVDERVLIPLDEWAALLSACPGELALAASAALDTESSSSGGHSGILSRLRTMRLPGARIEAVARRERIAELERDPQSAVAPWLSSCGPVSLDRLGSIFGLEHDDAARLCRSLEESGEAVFDERGFGQGQGPAVCSRDGLEALLRMTRRAARPSIKPRPAGSLAGFLALVQKVGQVGQVG